MNHLRTLNLTVATAIVLLATGCVVSHHSNKRKGEKVAMSIHQNDRTVRAAVETARKQMGEGTTRGLVTTAMVTKLVSFAGTGVKMLADKHKKQYVGTYGNKLQGLPFYSKSSELGCFDPDGMHFNGFTFLRMYQDKKGNMDTAVYARFSMDLSNPVELVENSVFRLRLEEFKLKNAKARADVATWYTPWNYFQKNHNEKINLQMEIIFKASYVNEQGELFHDTKLGSFFLDLADVPLNEKDKDYAAFYEKINKGLMLSGYCFIVPRSAGYNLKNNTYKKTYGTGIYSIEVNVTESAKDKMINKMIQENAEKMISGAEGTVVDKLKKD